MAKRYDPILCMMVDEPTKAQDAKKEEGFKILSAVIRGEKLVLTFEDLLNSPGKKETMEFTKKEAEAFKKDPWNTWTGNTKSVVEKFIGGKVHDANTLYETFAHGNSKHAGVLEMNGKAKVVVWNEGDNPRTGKVTVIGEDTPANRSKAKSMLDSAKAKDELSLAQKKQVVIELKGFLKKSYNFSDESEYARAYEDLRHMFTTGSRKSISGLFENTVKKTGAHDSEACDKDLPAFGVSYISGYAGGGVNRTEREYFHTEHEANKRAAELKSKNIKGVSVKKYENFYHTKDESYIVRGRKYKVVKRDGDNVTVLGPDGKVTKMDIDFIMSEGKKVRDVAPATQRYINTIVDESKANAEKFVRQAEQDDEVPENELKYVYKAYNEKFGYKFHDSASALDEAIKTADGMFASTFGEYAKGAKFKKDKFLKELSGISNAEEFAKRMQTLDNELKNSLERLDEAYNVAGKDYYAARNEIRSIMDAFSREAFSLYRKLGIK